MSRRAGAADRDRNDDEASAFAEAVRGARKLAGVGGAARISPLHEGKLPSGTRVAVGRPRSAGRDAGPGHGPGAASAGPSTNRRFAIDDSGEVWTARAEGVDRRLLRKLRAGDLPVEGRLDLHGLTRARAVQALERFVATSHAAGRRCLLIIHGRGLHSGQQGPTLREAVRTELTSGACAGSVLACGSAPPELGGAGAMLVWCRR